MPSPLHYNKYQCIEIKLRKTNLIFFIDTFFTGLTKYDLYIPS